jgi:HEPN domain-containing protein
MPPIEPKRPTAEAQTLLSAAEKDAKTVEVLLRHHDAPVSSVCFHAQQYIEKAIKAVLVSNDVIFRRTHDLEELADLLARKGIDLPISKDGLRRLNPFAVTTRYEDTELSLVDTQTISEMMAKTREWVSQHLSE